MALGEEQNTYKVNEPGKYHDPVSGKDLVVTMHAAADALVRLGWQRTADVSEEDIKDPYKEQAKAEPVAEPKKDVKEGVK